MLNVLFRCVPSAFVYCTDSRRLARSFACLLVRSFAPLSHSTCSLHSLCHTSLPSKTYTEQCFTWALDNFLFRSLHLTPAHTFMHMRVSVVHIFALVHAKHVHVHTCSMMYDGAYITTIVQYVCVCECVPYTPLIVFLLVLYRCLRVQM